MKILKSRKALSPVVASIILIAVTVAVSIAVAAWMGALTVGFMGSSSLTIRSVTFNSATSATLDVKNTGTNKVTIGQVKVNNAIAPTVDGTTTFDPGANGTITVTFSSPFFTAGNKYKFDIYDSSGQVVGSYEATAPS
ncbi:hypothetical protein KEJ45_02720 [Candidatus Bathyarchaeota archaeon]|nr:hypothetical protein [Candidatus Bathyarchaeota archaeon]